MLFLADRSDVMKEEVGAGELWKGVIIHQLQLQLLCFWQSLFFMLKDNVRSGYLLLNSNLTNQVGWILVYDLPIFKKNQACEIEEREMVILQHVSIVESRADLTTWGPVTKCCKGVPFP